MEDFILYNEIGHGSHSTVFKGRKSVSIVKLNFLTTQGSLEFLAIQSSEKSFDSISRRKFDFIRRIQHDRVLKAYKWCDTEAEV